MEAKPKGWWRKDFEANMKKLESLINEELNVQTYSHSYAQLLFSQLTSYLGLLSPNYKKNQVPNEPAKHQKDNTTYGNSMTSYGDVSSTYNTSLNNYVMSSSTNTKAYVSAVTPPINPVSIPLLSSSTNTKANLPGVTPPVNTASIPMLSSSTNTKADLPMLSSSTNTKADLPGVTPPINPGSLANAATQLLSKLNGIGDLAKALQTSDDNSTTLYESISIANSLLSNYVKPGGEIAVTAPTNLASLTNTPQVSKLPGTSSLGPAVNSSVGNTLVPIAGKDDMKLVTLEESKEVAPCVSIVELDTYEDSSVEICDLNQQLIGWTDDKVNSGALQVWTGEHKKSSKDCDVNQQLIGCTDDKVNSGALQIWTGEHKMSSKDEHVWDLETVEPKCGDLNAIHNQRKKAKRSASLSDAQKGNIVTSIILE